MRPSKERTELSVGAGPASLVYYEEQREPYVFLGSTGDPACLGPGCVGGVLLQVLVLLSVKWGSWPSSQHFSEAQRIHFQESEKILEFGDVGIATSSRYRIRHFRLQHILIIHFRMFNNPD